MAAPGRRRTEVASGRGFFLRATEKTRLPLGKWDMPQHVVRAADRQRVGPTYHFTFQRGKRARLFNALVVMIGLFPKEMKKG